MLLSRVMSSLNCKDLMSNLINSPQSSFGPPLSLPKLISASLVPSYWCITIRYLHMPKPPQSRLSHLVLHGCHSHLIPNVFVSYLFSPIMFTYPPENPHIRFSQFLRVLFLIGLERYGKGDWKSISRNAVVTRTPSQVASHAQKYFARQQSTRKERKRSSIHDITTAVDTNSVPPQSSFQNQSGSQDFNFTMPR